MAKCQWTIDGLRQCFKKNPGRGGCRVGAGAPRGNLNALKSGAYSMQLKQIRLEELRILRAAKASRARQAAKGRQPQAGPELRQG